MLPEGDKVRAAIEECKRQIIVVVLVVVSFLSLITPTNTSSFFFFKSNKWVWFFILFLSLNEGRWIFLFLLLKVWLNLELKVWEILILFQCLMILKKNLLLCNRREYILDLTNETINKLYKKYHFIKKTCLIL